MTEDTEPNPDMKEYTVKLGYWLRAYDELTVFAGADADAVRQAKAMATDFMDTLDGSMPDTLDSKRRQGNILFIDDISDTERRTVEEDVEFDDDRINALAIDGLEQDRDILFAALRELAALWESQPIRAERLRAATEAARAVLNKVTSHRDHKEPQP